MECYTWKMLFDVILFSSPPVFIFKESGSYHSPTLSLTASWLSDLSLPYITL